VKELSSLELASSHAGKAVAVPVVKNLKLQSQDGAPAVVRVRVVRAIRVEVRRAIIATIDTPGGTDTDSPIPKSFMCF